MKRKLRIKNFLTNSLLVVFSIALSIIVAEGVSRLIFDPIDYLKPYFVADDILGRRIEPNSAGHDAWGYRNKTVPTNVDVVAIGDSQTYGISATASNSWPAILQRITGKEVYNLSLGGYGPIEYSYLLESKALTLKPSLVIVGFYYGNDLHDVYSIVYSNDYWKHLRRPDFFQEEHSQASEKFVSNEKNMQTPDPNSRKIESDKRFLRNVLALREWFAYHSVLYRVVVEASPAGDLIRFFQAKYGYSEDDITIVEDEANNIYTGLTPAVRLDALNLNDPKVQEGLRISLVLFGQMNELAIKEGVDFLVVLIPTKERVFASHIENNKALHNSAIIDQFLANERRVNELVKADFEEHDIAYVDLLGPLQSAVGREQIYPTNHNSHPNKNGYTIIARTIQRYLAETTLN